MHRILGRIIPVLSVIVRFLWRTTVLIVRTIGISLVSFINGVPQTTARMAAEWESMLILEYKLPSIYAQTYFRSARILAVVIVVIGWVCFSFTTVFLVMWLIR